MLVYRIERFDGQGPYGNPNNAPTFRDHGGICGSGIKSHLHPNPYQDEGIADWWMKETFIFGIGSAFRNAHIFGFSSKDQMKAWFFTKKAKTALHKDGFFVAVYKVRKNYVVLGHAQALFKKEKAEFVEAFDVRYM